MSRSSEAGDPAYDWQMPADEWQALALGYTSGTSGRPKGVVYHHRGAYLMSMGTATGWPLPQHPTYLYIVPMFHCNGWCHAWTMTMMAATIVLTRVISADAIFGAITEHRVTHFGGAPIVLSMLVNAPEAQKPKLDYTVKAFTAGAPPPAAILQKMTEMGFEVMQVYGLTETYGHVTQCVWREEWDGLGFEEQANLQSWQGVGFPMHEGAAVMNTDSGELVPRDGETQGEIVLRGNAVMKGYYKDPDATRAALHDGWFFSGDAAVWHDNGYIQIKDRLKDVIISGGENISSVEVEGYLYRHPAVAAAAVVAKADDKWGEVPCAFVELKPGESVSEADFLEWCRSEMAGFKRPKQIIFGELPKTSTGKIQKFVLRQQGQGIIPSRHADWGPAPTSIFCAAAGCCHPVCDTALCRMVCGWACHLGRSAVLRSGLLPDAGFGEWVSAKIHGRCGFATFFRLCLAVFMGMPIITLWPLITLGPFITCWSLVMLWPVIALRPISPF
jgi:fatty-acyl-CoA synthase